MENSEKVLRDKIENLLERISFRIEMLEEFRDEYEILKDSQNANKCNLRISMLTLFQDSLKEVLD